MSAVSAPTPAEPLLELKDVHAYYGAIHALKGVSMAVGDGEIVTLLGANGAGKSTTLRTISGLHAPAQGQHRLRRRRPHAPQRARRSSRPAWRSRPRAAACSGA